MDVDSSNVISELKENIFLVTKENNASALDVVLSDLLPIFCNKLDTFSLKYLLFANKNDSSTTENSISSTSKNTFLYLLSEKSFNGRHSTQKNCENFILQIIDKEHLKSLVFNTLLTIAKG